MKYSHHIIVTENLSTFRVLIEMSVRVVYPSAAISIAPDGQSTLEIFEGRSADLIICDKDASPMNGFELTRTLRDEGFDGLIIIMSDDQSGAKEAEEAGATLFMNKSGIPNLLPLVVSRLLPLTGQWKN